MSKKLVFHVSPADPFEEDPANANIFYEAYGKAICLWGRFERHFESSILLLWSLPCCHKHRPSMFPLGWTRKAKFWRDMFSHVPELDKHSIAAIRLIDDANDASKDRNVMLHSSWWGFSSSQPLTAHFRSMRLQSSHWLFEECEITLSKLNLFTTNVDTLNTKLLPLTWFMMSLQKSHDVTKDGTE